MKKHLLILALLFCTYVSSYAYYTTIYSEIKTSAVWSGTVYISETTTIKAGAKITVKQGTVIKLAHGASILAESTSSAYPSNELLLDAVASSPIYFTSMDDDTMGEIITGSDGVPEAGDWGSVWLNASKVYIDHIRMTYGGGTSYSIFYVASLMVKADTCLITNSVISESGTNGLTLLKNGNIENCYINKCDGHGITTSIAIVDSLTFKNCTVESNKGMGINASAYAGSFRVTDCTIEYNGNDGLNIYGSNSSIGETLASRCYIQSCSINHNDGKAVTLKNVTMNTPFTGNSIKQNKQNAFYITSFRDTEESSLYSNSGIPYVLESDVSIYDTLNIHEGTILKFASYNFEVETTGTLNILGTKTNPVIFTTINDDTYGGDTNSDDITTSPEVNLTISSQGTLNIEHSNFYYSQISSRNMSSIRSSTFKHTTGAVNSAISGKARIDSCTFEDNFYGVYATEDTCYVNQCVFINNDAGIVNRESVVVRNSRFENNRLGVKSSYGEHTDLGKNTTDSIGNNVFTLNTEYDVYNNSENIVYALNNTWDGTTAAEIDAKLFDNDENTSYGEVIFSLEDCELSKLPQPTGIVEICEDISVNVYTVVNDNQTAVVNWMISPTSSGTLNPNGNEVSIEWNTSYIGDIELWAYLSEDDCVGENSGILVIERIAKPAKSTITQIGNSLYNSTFTECQWYKRVGEANSTFLEPIDGANIMVFAPEENGTYVVEVWNITNCTTLSDDFVFNFTSNQGIESHEFEFFPNPSNGNLIVNLFNKQEGSIEIYNAFGSLVFQQKISDKSNRLELNLKPGSYFIRVDAQFRKLIIL